MTASNPTHLNDDYFRELIMTVGQPAKRRNDDEDSDSDSPAPPDGGWGWMVVFGSFMIHIISTYSLFLIYFISPSFIS